jgi:hypothetical protein
MLLCQLERVAGWGTPYKCEPRPSTLLSFTSFSIHSLPPPFFSCKMATASQRSPLVQSVRILKVLCPNHEPCVAGLSAPLCNSCVQFIGDAWNASGLNLEGFSAAIRIQITSHPPLPPLVSQVPDAVGHLHGHDNHAQAI